MQENKATEKMITAYICSPYKAESEEEQTRNIEYAQEITREAIKAGYAPITPHLYMTQCLDDSNPKEREKGLAAGIELLSLCEVMIIGIKYGVSKGMMSEIHKASQEGVEIIEVRKIKSADERKKESDAISYAQEQKCLYCGKGSFKKRCTLEACKEAHEKAKRAFEEGILIREF